MEFEWDDTKSLTTEAERGFTFGFAAGIFDDRCLVWADDRFDYGEHRMVAIGRVEGQVLTVIFTDRGSTRRIISARRASRKERRQWQSFENLSKK